MDDSGIVARYLRRDETAIALTAERYGARLRALSFGITQDHGTAEECENDVYLEAWSSIPPHEPRTYLYAFLARIARHLSLNRCRDRARLKRGAYLVELSAELEQCLPAPDDLACRLDEMILLEAINGFLAGLGAEKRNLFVRRYWYLDSVAMLAKRFSRTEGSVKTALHRLRAQLKTHLEKEGYVL